MKEQEDFKGFKVYDHYVMIELPNRKDAEHVADLVRDYQDGECNILYGKK
jgi:hypothetical protein